MKIYPSKIHNSVSEGIKKSELLHNIDPNNALIRIKKRKPRKVFAWRKWNGKTQQWEKIYKDHPPRDPFYSR